MLCLHSVYTRNDNNTFNVVGNADLSFGEGCYLFNGTGTNVSSFTIDVYNCTQDTISFLYFENTDCSLPVNGSYVIDWNPSCLSIAIFGLKFHC